MIKIYQHLKIGFLYFCLRVNEPDFNRNATVCFDISVINFRNKKEYETGKIIFMFKIYKLENWSLKVNYGKSKIKMFCTLNIFGKVLTNERFGL